MDENMKTLKKQYMDECMDYMDQLMERLKDTHTVMGTFSISSRNDNDSWYLVPNGTEEQVTYYGKPVCSFRVSGHWNWRASKRKCVVEDYIQCYTKDLHYPYRRESPEYPSKPIFACCVAYYGLDRLYHVVCGEVYDKGARQNRFIKRDIDEVISEMQEDMLDEWRKSA